MGSETQPDCRKPVQCLWTMTASERMSALGPFLRRQYLNETGTRPSSLAVRDLGVRCVYIACCFSMFSMIERLAVAWWPSRDRPD